MQVSEFINNLTEVDPEYILVPEDVDLSGVTIWMMERSFSYGNNYPDGIYYDRELARLEEIVTVSSRYTT